MKKSNRDDLNMSVKAKTDMEHPAKNMKKAGVKIHGRERRYYSDADSNKHDP